MSNSATSSDSGTTAATADVGGTAPPVIAAAQAAQAASDAAKAAATNIADPNKTTDPNAAKPADPNAQAAADKAAADKATADKAVAKGAPENYTEFKIPEGLKANAETIAEVTAFAKANNLSQEAAQALIDLGGKVMKGNVESQVQLLQAAGAEWAKQAAADKEYGGDRLGENLSIAKKAVDKFASPGLKKLLGNYDPKDNPNGTGLGNHPEMIRAFLSIGKTISEDTVVTGGEGSTNQNRSAADILYGGSTK